MLKRDVMSRAKALKIVATQEEVNGVKAICTALGFNSDLTNYEGSIRIDSEQILIIANGLLSFNSVSEDFKNGIKKFLQINGL